MGEISQKIGKIISKKNLFLLVILLMVTSLVFLFFGKKINSLPLLLLFTFFIDFAFGLLLQISVRGKSLEARLYASISSFFQNWKFILTGQGLWQGFSWFFDNPIYIAVINWAGPIKGYFIMMPISVFGCLMIMLYYNRQKKDWLGTEKYSKFTGKIYSAFKKLENKVEEKRWVLKTNSFNINPAKIFSILLWFFEFTVLSFWQDPFITTMFLKRSNRKMERKDWAVFVFSGIISNGYWTLRNFALIEIFKLLWKTFAT
jgi:hypothetical protein